MAQNDSAPFRSVVVTNKSAADRIWNKKMVSEGKIPADQDNQFDSQRMRVDKPSAAISDVTQYLREAIEQASIYISAQAGRLRALIRYAVIFGILGIAALFVALTIVVVSAVLFCIGIAEGISLLLGGRQWAGDLIAGGGVLVVISIGAFIATRKVIGSSRRQTIESYEKRKTDGPVL